MQFTVFAIFAAFLPVTDDNVARAPKPTAAQEIIQKSVQANDRDWQQAPAYSHTETTKDANGYKTSRVTMLFGSPYSRLISVNGQPLPPDEQKREQKKFDKEYAQRRSESPEATARRVAAYEKERERDHLMMEQLTSAFDFQLAGETRFSGRNVYFLQATPRKGYRPPNMEAQVLTGMKGELWIDKETFQWVKVRAQVISPVTIGGFLATVQPGTYFKLEKMPVDRDTWLPKHFSVESQSKVLGVFHHATAEDETYADYEKTPATYVSRQNPAATRTRIR